MGVYFNPPPPLPNRKRGDMGTKLSVKIDGREVNLEDAVEVFEDLFDDDLEKVFDHMETTFAHIDKNIKEKMNKLKMKLAVTKPDKYEFIPESGYEKDRLRMAMEKAQHEEMMELRKMHKRKGAAIRNTFVGVTLFLFIMLGIIFFISVESSNKSTKQPAAIEQPTTSNSDGSTL